jgi:hypothetical protein
MLYSSQHDNRNEDGVEYKELDLEKHPRERIYLGRLARGREEIIDS